MSTSSTPVHVEVRRGAYADSVTLLRVSRDVAATPGVTAAQVAMATPLNVDVLTSMGFEVPEATANDMVVALRVESADGLPDALAAVDAALAASVARTPAGSPEAVAPRTTASALAATGASVALVSVPGASATVEAADALDAGRDVMIFSDNVPLDQEIALKRVADDRGLLAMGPDCGTALIGGVGLGFANAVQPGPVGIVAASGTGCQQLMCLLDAAGTGVGAALGVGGRDLSAEVGGLATRQALRRLDADPAIEQIVVVSKPPAAEVADALRAFVDELRTPVHLALLGAGQPDLTAAAEAVLATLGRPVPRWPAWGETSGAGDGYLRGLFVGGTLCDEAMLLATEAFGPVHSNIPLDPAYALDASMTADGHLMIDFGDDSMTAGRAHPMIDPTMRLEYLRRVTREDDTGVVLLDVVLGHAAEPDPADALAPAITEAVDRGVRVVVACVGTSADPQGLDRQAERLADAGAEVFTSNAQAARRAIALTGGAR